MIIYELTKKKLTDKKNQKIKIKLTTHEIIIIKEREKNKVKNFKPSIKEIIVTVKG